MGKKRSGRIYWREQGGVRRAYGDFRDYADVGGGREALIAPGQKRATDSQDVAAAIAAKRVQTLEATRRGTQILGTSKQAVLGQYAAQHLIKKKQSGQTTDHELGRIQKRLEAAVAFMARRKRVADAELSSVGVEDVQAWMASLYETLPAKPRKRSTARTTAAPGTVRHYLMALSNLYRRAQGEGFVPPGYNPVGALMDKPQVTRSEAEWLDVPEAALFLEAARLYRPKQTNYLQFAYPLVATFLLTGGRAKEIAGLEIRDVSFDRKTVAFRPNDWRTLKTGKSQRSVRLWPQLEGVLSDYLHGPNAPTGRLLFPAKINGVEQMITDERKMLAAISTLSGSERHITPHIFRHTYCAARLQTLDGGAPVSAFTVSKELGHGGFSMVERVYGHLGEYRHRSEVVEYDLAQHATALATQLKRLRVLAASQSA